MTAISKETESLSEKQERQRTLTQNRSLHVWFAQSSQALRDGGYTLKQVLASIPEIEMTPVAMKEIWRQIQIVMVGKESTRDLTTKELQEVWEVVNREILLKRGIAIPFPCNEPPIYNPEEYGY